MADITDLPSSWSWPEPVTTRAADGTTPICGVVFRPSDYSPARRYPVLDLSWSYPEPVRAFHEGPGGESYLSAAAWAELGFIVVKFENRGGDFRGRNFREAIDPQLPLHNKADCVAGIQQLAANDPSMDLDRVGVVDQHGTPPAALNRPAWFIPIFTESVFASRPRTRDFCLRPTV